MGDEGDGAVKGLRRGLTNYGDRGFSAYLRRSFAGSMGYSRGMLERPIVGIAHSASDYNNCHRHFPEKTTSRRWRCGYKRRAPGC